MYKVIKDKGIANVFLVNTDTSASLNLGTPTSLTLLKILLDIGHDLSDKLSPPWDFEVDEETKDKLSKLALHIHRPVRIKTKATASEQDSKNKQPVDVFNLIFGIEE